MTEFQELIKKAIGPNRTQSEFAKDAGITPQYLNRLLNSDAVGKPTKSTLAKLAGNSFSGIPLATFMKACGYEDTEDTMKSELRKLPIYERIQRCVETITDGIKKLSGSNTIYNSLYECVDTFFTIYDEEDVSVYIGKPMDVPKGEVRFAEKASVITISWSDEYDFEVRNVKYKGFSAKLDILIFYSETTGGSVIICDVKTDQKSLIDYNSDVAFELDSMGEYREDGYACVIQYNRKHKIPTGATAEERLLNAIFGDKDGKTYTVVDAGPGFYIDNTPIYVIKNFIESHKDSLDDVCISRHEQLKDTLTEQNIMEYETNESYPSYLINCIIRNESGLTTVSNCDTKFESNRLAVIYPAKHPWNYSDAEKEMSKSTVNQILDKYARELRSKVEFCHNVWEAESEYFD